MDINKNVEAIIVTLLYLTCIYFWTLPIQQNPFPYGEVDAASHYAIADYTYYSDSSITDLPPYIDERYGQDNKFKPHTLWYPPPFHTAFAISAVFGGGSDIPIYLTNAIFCSLIVLAVYFIIRKFFGFGAALASALLIIFSIRDIFVYMWGQWPERMGFAYLPLIIYCFYKYTRSYLVKEEKPIYMYILVFLLAINFFIHPMDFFHSVAALIVIGVFFLIKERRIFFSIKHVVAAVVLFFLIISIFPSQTLNVFVRLQTNVGETGAVGDISRLFYWFKPQEDNAGVPQVYFSYKSMIGPYWTVPLVFLGALFLVLRRRRKDLVILGWLVSLYIMIHLDFIGKGRVHRSLSGTAHIFYPLMVIGVFYLVSFMPKLKNYKIALRYGVLGIFVLLMLFSVGSNAYSFLKDAYGGVSRINPYQYEAAKWLRQSKDIVEDPQIFHIGSLSLMKTRWFWMISHKHIIHEDYEKNRNEIDYVIVDYSDFALIGDTQNVAKIQQWEDQNLANSTIIYKNDYMRVFEFEN